MKKLISANIVIVANNMNPSIFSSLWLVKEGILNEKDFVNDYVYTPMATSIPTPDFKLDVFPERLQIAFTDRSLDSPKLVTTAVDKIIHKLPHTPYVAIGANIHWIGAPDPHTAFVTFTRNLFVKPDIPLYDKFSDTNARFGGYMSKVFLGARMKVDIKPRLGGPEDEVEEFLNFTFNYHLPLEDGRQIEQMQEFLGNWEALRSESESVVHSVLDED